MLDLAASSAKAAALIADAGATGAALVVFPEAFLGGYPAWIWRTRAQDDAALLGRLYKAFTDAAVDLATGGLDPIAAAAKAAGTTVVIGFNEIERHAGQTTIYNSVAVLGPDGAILNVHRKLMPTGPERTIWGQGDARGLRVVETPAGRIGTLICWENYMPLSRFALYAQGLDILVAPTWDHDDSWTASMRHIAKEAACWVVSVATSLRVADLPPSLTKDIVWGDDWICRGNALVTRPFGTIVAGPAAPELATLEAEIDLGAVAKARRMLDVAGHYARPDIFELAVDRNRRTTVRFTGGEARSRA
jgi:nitrilase